MTQRRRRLYPILLFFLLTFSAFVLILPVGARHDASAIPQTSGYGACAYTQGRPRIIQSANFVCTRTIQETNITGAYQYQGYYGTQTFRANSPIFSFTDLFGNTSVKASTVLLKTPSGWAIPIFKSANVAKGVFTYEEYRLFQDCGSMQVAFNPNYWKANFTITSWTGNCGLEASTSIVWVGVSGGGNYISTDGSSLTSINSTATAAFRSINSTGGASRAFGFSKASGNRVGVEIGGWGGLSADVGYFSIRILAKTWYVWAVIFPSGMAAVDPSIVQKNSGTCSGTTTCTTAVAFSTNTASGNLLVVAVSMTDNNGITTPTIDTPTDTQTNTFASVTSVASSGAAVRPGSAIFGVVTSTSGADTISVVTHEGGGSGHTVIGYVWIYEVGTATATGATGNSAECDTCTSDSVTSTSFTGAPFLIEVMVDTAGLTGGSVTTGFTADTSQTNGLAGYATSGISSPTTFAISGFPSGNIAESGAQFPVGTVTEKVTITPANSYSSADSATITGTSCSASTIAMDALQHSFTCTASTSLTISTPTDGATLRYRAAGESTTILSYTTAGSGTDTKTATVYAEFKNTYTASSANTFPASATVAVQGELSGTITTSACSIAVGGTTSASCSAATSWFDYNTPVNFQGFSSQGSSTSQFGAVPLSYGLVGCWMFDEGSGTSAFDCSGNANTGTLTNSPTWQTGANCKFGSCLSFASASSQYVSIGSNVLGASPTALTLTAWVNRAATGANHFIYSNDNGATTLHFTVNANDFAVCEGGAGSGFQETDSSNTIPANSWHYLVCVMTTSGTSLTATIYVDGVQQGTGTNTIGTLSLGATTYLAVQTGNQNFMNGKLDDVRAYNRALSASEISELKSATVPVITFSDTTGGNTHTVTFLKSDSETASYSISGGGTPTAPTLSFNNIGTAQTFALTTTGQTLWLDEATSWSTTNPTSDSTSTARFDANSGTSGTPSAGGTINPAYYHQYLYTLDYSVTGGGTPTAPTLTSTQFGASYTPTLTTSPVGYWLDNSATCSVTNPTTGSTSTERWDTNTACPTVSATQTIVFAYYNQYACTCSYSGTVAVGGAPSLAGNAFGAVSTVTLPSVAPMTIWKDSGAAYTITKPTADFPSATERYDTNTANGTTSAAFTLAPAFYHQYVVTNPGSLSMSPTQFGAVATATTVNAFNDNNAALSVAATFTCSFTVTNASYIYQFSPSGVQALTDSSISGLQDFSTSNPPYVNFIGTNTHAILCVKSSSLNSMPNKVTVSGASIAFAWVNPLLTFKGTGTSVPFEVDWNGGSSPSSTPSSGGGGGTYISSTTTTVTSSGPPVPASGNEALIPTGLGVLTFIFLGLGAFLFVRDRHDIRGGISGKNYPAGAGRKKWFTIKIGKGKNYTEKRKRTF